VSAYIHTVYGRHRVVLYTQRDGNDDDNDTTTTTETTMTEITGVVDEGWAARTSGGELSTGPPAARKRGRYKAVLAKAAE